MILKTSRSNLSSNDQLALDLPFAATKSLTARIGPTPTFTRGSGATYIGSDGLIHGVDTSTTSNTIGTGSRTFTLAATAGQDQFWRAGDAVEASNGSNIMTGTVTSYDAATQSLVCNMTTASGTGTFTSWRIGYRGPRFDHTSAGVCRGLLIEESRTNLYSRSEEFETGAWVKTRSSITADATTAPDGTLTADKLVEDTTASNTHIIQSAITPPATAHTLSVFAKKGERTWIVLRLGGANTFFNLDDGTIAAGSSNSPTITNFGNGWYRCTVTSSAGTQGQFWLATNSTTTSYTGDGTSGLFLWGAQLEAGSFATSYIPTTTGSVVRSADVCSITGANFTSFFGSSPSEFTYNTAFTHLPTSTLVPNVRVLVDFANGGNRRWLYGDAQANNLFQGKYFEVVNNVNIGVASSYPYRVALALTPTTNFFSVNGATAGSGVTSGTLLSNVTGLQIGQTGSYHFQYLRGYKKRLSNAKLQALTA